MVNYLILSLSLSLSLSIFLLSLLFLYLSFFSLSLSLSLSFSIYLSFFSLSLSLSLSIFLLSLSLSLSLSIFRLSLPPPYRLSFLLTRSNLLQIETGSVRDYPLSLLLGTLLEAGDLPALNKSQKDYSSARGSSELFGHVNHLWSRQKRRRFPF